MRDSVVIYRSFHEASKALAPEEYKELWTALFQYALNDEDPEEIESPLAEVIYKMALPQIDANKKRHDDGCKGGRPKKPLVIEEKNHRLENNKPNVNENVNDNVNENVNVNVKKSKHKLGDYQHVLLTEEEDQKLTAEFGKETRDKAVAFLDEYIEEKNYKSKSHYLAIRRWVITAVKEAEAKQAKKPAANNNKIHNYNERNYDYDALMKELTQ